MVDVPPDLAALGSPVKDIYVEGGIQYLGVERPDIERGGDERPQSHGTHRDGNIRGLVLPQLHFLQHPIPGWFLGFEGQLNKSPARETFTFDEGVGFRQLGRNIQQGSRHMEGGGAKVAQGPQLFFILGQAGLVVGAFARQLAEFAQGDPVGQGIFEVTPGKRVRIGFL